MRWIDGFVGGRFFWLKDHAVEDIAELVPFAGFLAPPWSSEGFTKGAESFAYNIPGIPEFDAMYPRLPPKRRRARLYVHAAGDMEVSIYGATSAALLNFLSNERSRGTHQRRLYVAFREAMQALQNVDDGVSRPLERDDLEWTG